MTNQIKPVSPNVLFMPADADKNMKSSIGRFITWLDSRQQSWINADLKNYLDYLNTTGLARSSVKKHMERIRARYKEMQHSNAVRDMIQSRIPKDATPADVYAVTEEFLTRLRNNTEYDKRLEVKLTTVASFVDSDFTWLTYEDINALFERIPVTKIGYRDALIFSLCLSFGLREAEACVITVEDLKETQNGQSGVLVRHGKGDKRRFVVRDEFADYTGILQGCMDTLGITSGLVLQGLKPRQLQNRVKIYTEAKPHDLRRSYAKLLHNGGRSIEYIKQQLGHVKSDTTLIYLGMINK